MFGTNNRNININDLDRPDYVPQPQSTGVDYDTCKRESKRGSSLKLWLTSSLIAAAGVGFVLWLLASWLEAEYHYNSTFATIVQGGLYFVAVCVFLFIGGALLLLLFGLFGKATRAGLVELPGGMSAHSLDVVTGWQRGTARGVATAMMERHYDVQHTLAERSAYRNVTSYSPSIQQHTGAGIPATALTPELVAPADLMAQAEWIDALNESPHLLIYGPSKAGKSTIAQAYVATFGGSAEYVVIDPMPNKPGESKWGSIDFVTLDEGTGDEFASIKAALDRIAVEDERRRRTMRTETFAPLIIIIDEVLGLVDALGIVKNAEGKNEPRMSNFMRKMGYSARHRNIKIILIGQGKNLNDLALKSGTARNNYALVRAERNAATNERAAYIVTPEGERAIDASRVPALAQEAAQHAGVWLTHSQLQQEGDILSSLLGATADNEVVPSDDAVATSVAASQGDVSAVAPVIINEGERAEIAFLLGSLSPSDVVKQLTGYNGRNYKEYRAKVDAVAAELASH